MGAADMLDKALAGNMSEAAWQEEVTSLASMLGWKWCHTHRSIGKGRRWTTATNVVGWPDLLLYRPDPDGNGEILFAELKSEHGVVSDDQVRVHEDLRRSGQEVHVWRPSDLDAVAERLGRHRNRRRKP